MNEELFDVSNVEDLPEDIKKELKPINSKGSIMKEDTRILFSLFEIKNELSIDEIIAGMYRAHKIKKTRKWVYSILYNWKREGIFKESKNKKGVYEKIKRGELCR